MGRLEPFRVCGHVAEFLYAPIKRSEGASAVSDRCHPRRSRQALDGPPTSKPCVAFPGQKKMGRDDGWGSVDPFRQSSLVVMTTRSHLQYFEPSSPGKVRKEGWRHRRRKEGKYKEGGQEDWKDRWIGGRKDRWKEGRRKEEGRRTGGKHRWKKRIRAAGRKEERKV